MTPLDTPSAALHSLSDRPAGIFPLHTEIATQKGCEEMIYISSQPFCIFP